MAKTRGHKESEVGQTATWNQPGANAAGSVPPTAIPTPLKAESSAELRDIEPFFRREYSRVWRWVQRMGVPLAEADDVAQEVFLTAVRRQPETLTRAWIYQVTRRVCSHYRRGRGRALERSRGISWAPSGVTEASQAEQIAQRRRAERFARFLERLPDEQREPFELVVLEGLSASEVANLLSVPRNTIYTRLRRARQKLTDWLAKENPDD